MSSSAKVPALLEPYLGLPDEAGLVTMTSVLGASANWLVARWLYSLLAGNGNAAARAATMAGRDGNGGGRDTAVVLVSFMRDGAFWKSEVGRLGIDLDAQAKSKHFTFVDGLTGLYTPSKPASTAGVGTHVIRSSKVDDVRRSIERAIADVHAEGRKTVLVVDQVDAWLATAGEDSGVTSLAVQGMMLGLRERVHATVMTLSADHPLLHAQTTTLEKEHAALVLSSAHAADTVMALRILDTGAAKDVSGVVRITSRERDSEGGGEGDKGVEYLYFVAGDGGVRVFERGT